VIGSGLALAAYQSSLRILLPFLRLRRRYFRDPAMARERAGEIVVPLRYQTGDPRLWYHGASVGEISALPPILAEMERRAPGGRAMVSALTDTGLDSARRLFSPERVFALPIDLPGPLARAMDALQPTALVIAETELWPSLCGLARARRVPILIVNGRLSPKSVRRYRTLGPLFRPAAQALAGVAAQSEGDRERFIAIGVPSRAVAVLGSSKFDAVPWDPPPTPPSLLAGRPVVVCGSTREGDERLVVDLLSELDRMAPAPQVLTVIAPRHLPRVPAIQALLRRQGFEPRLRSADPAPLAEAVASSAARGDRILLLDSLGELAAAYRLGVAAIVGGGFSAPGGHNLLEPAARGRAVAFGMKQRSAAGEDELLVAAGGGFRCADARALARSLAPLVRDLATANDAGRRARAAVAGARGAAARIADFILARLALGERGTP
jgi:3-deoxy-D-manno-octulosonic-acid transferase